MKTIEKNFSARCRRLGLVCLVLFTSLAAAAGPDVGLLRCEYRDNPLGIDTPQPRLSWQMAGRGQGPGARGQRQTAYQIVVASTPELLAQGQGDLWDSGKVASDQSLQVAYAGKPLPSRQQCHWKVKVWSGAGEGSASKPALWSMGLLGPEAWQAKWIGSPTAAIVEPVPLLRKTFALDKPIKRATAHVSGLGYYELSINGKKVGDHELDPKFTRYDRRVQIGRAHV